MAGSSTTVVSFKESTSTTIPKLAIQSSNLMANLDASIYPANIQIIIECLKYSVLSTALTLSKSVPQSLLNLAFSTSVYQRENDIVQFEVFGGKKLTVDKQSFCLLFGLETGDSYVVPTAEDLVHMFNQMGYTPFMTKISQFKKNKLPTLWNFFFTVFKRCLCGRKGGQDSASQLFLTALYGVYFDVKVDYGSILWYEFLESLKGNSRNTELSSHRFWYVIIHSAYTVGQLPLNVASEAPMVCLPFLVPTKFASQSEFNFVGQVPEDMLKRVPATNYVLIAYRKTLVQPYPIRTIPSSILQQIYAQVAKPTKKRK